MRLALLGTIAISVTLILAQMLSGTQAAAVKNAIGKVAVKAYAARDGSKCAFAETITRADGRTVIRISEGGVDTAVGRAPRGDAVSVDGVPVPDPTAPARGGGAGRGGQGGGAPAQGGAR